MLFFWSSVLTYPCPFPSPLFLPLCSQNMLYPKENRVEKKLMFVCRRCGYQVEAENAVVFKHELVKSAK